MAGTTDLKIPGERLVAFCRRNGIRKLSLYGSVLKKTMGPDSDIDLLVEFCEDRLPGFFLSAAWKTSSVICSAQRLTCARPRS